jgi:hypothetical protein
MNDHALVSMRINDRTRSGRASVTRRAMDPPIEWPSTSTGPPTSVSMNAITSSAMRSIE